MNRRTPESRSLLVQKRDGRTEPFDAAKLTHCIRMGLVAGGEGGGAELRVAVELARSVVQYLCLRDDAAPISSVHVEELADLILRETGHIRAAEAVRGFARFRAWGRRHVVVLLRRKSDSRLIRRRWSKRRMSTSLMADHGLDLCIARFIAGRVEHLIFNCGLKQVTAGLVAEMIRCELLAWGLHDDALAAGRRNSSCNPIHDGS